MNNPQIATLSLALLWDGAHHQPFQYTDREDIAIRANELAPGRFAWRKYPQNIEIEIVGKALRDAKKEKNGSLVIGDNEKGWILSPAGAQWALTEDVEANSNTMDALRACRRAISALLDRERGRLRAIEVLQCGEEGVRTVTQASLYEFAYINEYFDARARWRRFCIVESAIGAQTTLTDWWQSLQERFPEEMAGWPKSTK